MKTRKLINGFQIPVKLESPEVDSKGRISSGSFRFRGLVRVDSRRLATIGYGEVMAGDILYESDMIRNGCQKTTMIRIS